MDIKNNYKNFIKNINFRYRNNNDIIYYNIENLK